jgi:hypothetical protein
MSVALLAGLALSLAAAASAEAQPRSPLSISASSAANRWQPVVRIDGLLQDAVLRDALHSGLPLRLHLRVELWRDAIFDQLADAQEALLALSYDPLDRSYLFEAGRTPQRFATLADAEAAIGSIFLLPLGPRGSGRYYYLASLEVETLSLSDLDELRRWLRGDARAAVTGRTPVGRAVERGLRRAFVRVVGLATRRYESRTPSFVVR